MRAPEHLVRQVRAGCGSSLYRNLFTRPCAFRAAVFIPLTGNSVVQSGKSFPGGWYRIVAFPSRSGSRGHTLS